MPTNCLPASRKQEEHRIQVGMIEADATSSLELPESLHHREHLVFGVRCLDPAHAVCDQGLEAHIERPQGNHTVIIFLIRDHIEFAAANLIICGLLLLYPMRHTSFQATPGQPEVGKDDKNPVPYAAPLASLLRRKYSRT
jgi:hypothetical protein